ncbi:MAG: Ig domain-containing protein, partial [Paludibacteraceae bacterium]|nr:Ig domain-containing protein [Paludibacteraceae bacterium]
AVTGVTLNQNEAQMTVGGETLTLTATVNPDNATDQSVSWSTSDANVATVENGVVTAVAAGNATITVTTTDGSFTATCAVTVTAPEPQGVVTLILANLPEENRPATIELAGTFDEGTAELEKLDTGWFIYNFIHASADATGKFRDKTNPNMVLCEFIPANGDEEGKWVQAIFKISDYGYWDEDGWKGTACMWTEIDVTGEQYAWMENAPEPTGIENIVLTEKATKRIVNGQLVIEKNGVLYNAQGAIVK